MKKISFACTFAVVLVCLAWSHAGLARATAPSYPGTIDLRIDLTRVEQRVFPVHESIPVKPGPLTLYYPKWIPGSHSPSGTILAIAGLKFVADGKTLDWHRDRVDMYAFHLDVPAGASKLEVTFDYLPPVRGRRLVGSIAATPEWLNLEWNRVVLYPKGYASSAITIKPTVRLPDGWHFATALQPHHGTGSGPGTAMDFAPVTLNNLVDSPIIAGRHFKQIKLTHGDSAPVYLDMVADAADDLDITPEQIKNFRALVTQETRMFQSHHYDSFHILLTLTDHKGRTGLEHHQSSNDSLSTDYFRDPNAYLIGADLISHEYTHSWNGKFRRPADLWTPDFNTTPMKGDLLWVYEGLTQYWSEVMAARSGLMTSGEFRQALAMFAAGLDHVPGRTWESLQDATSSTGLKYREPNAWSNWRRGAAVYAEGILLWLDVDTRIRMLSHGKHSLDDFARLFFGMDNGSHVTSTYTFNDVIAALDKVQPYDWKTYLRNILDARQYHVDLNGLTQGGWKLVYTNKPSARWQAARKAPRNAFGYAESRDAVYANQMYSIGASMAKNGKVVDVLWNGPAFKAGLSPGMRITAVNGKKFSRKNLHEAIRNARQSRAPVRLSTRNFGHDETLEIDYHGGLRYPHLERIEGTPDRITRITVPLE